MKTTKTSPPRALPLSAKRLRIGIVASTFNREITDRLVKGAVSCLVEHGGRSLIDDVVRVPGAFELPYAADLLARTGRYDAIVCLGAVIRGETPHFEFISSECARGIQEVMLTRRCPVAFGVLTTDTLRQAKDRSGGAHGNKGWDAAWTAIEMALLSGQFTGRRRKA